MKYIPLHPTVIRCRPKPGFTQLLNDCGHQAHCARRIAANLSGNETEDLSQYAMGMHVYVGCSYYVPFDGCDSYRDPQMPKSMQEPV